MGRKWSSRNVLFETFVAIDASRFSGGFNNGASHVRERGRGGGGGWNWAGALRGAGLSDPRGGGGGNAKVDRNDRKLGNTHLLPPERFLSFFSRFFFALTLPFDYFRFQLSN